MEVFHSNVNRMDSALSRKQKIYVFYDAYRCAEVLQDALQLQLEHVLQRPWKLQRCAKIVWAALKVLGRDKSHITDQTMESVIERIRPRKRPAVLNYDQFSFPSIIRIATLQNFVYKHHKSLVPFCVFVDQFFFRINRTHATHAWCWRILF